ncbi:MULTISPECIES: flavodoxin family protein [Gordonibacter]|uniref:Flavodoxin family protein n=1 Tax=Gordonibacter faecis TaxID=3047475 RepID=A0ABT7DJS4_9ACTN|nr:MULTISPECIES: flavodoxin family protein [unclassified Gordonibacter]MDJ1649767.1 flavodoxin family protein [Gordonibacter sp. KGMB12511]HIW75433.1 flavodoxin family protein [Candidatus Gordonibacter avicola]
MNRLIIVGSPRPNGRSAALADMLFEACIEEYPADEVALAPVSMLEVQPCSGCDSCRYSEAPAEGEPGRCAIDDDMADVYELIDAADELVVVSPVYFAGPPAQLKALLDRLQPYFWTPARTRPKRPATLHVVGEGGDPHGFDPLVGIVRSALAGAGFQLERVLDWVGKIDEDGEIVAEAEEHLLGEADSRDAGSSETPARSRDEVPEQASAASSRPVLSVSPGGKAAKGHKTNKPSSSPAKGESRPRQGGTQQGGSSKQGRSNKNSGASGAKRNGKRRG